MFLRAMVRVEVFISGRFSTLSIRIGQKPYIIGSLGPERLKG